jgi:hypothetical protein
VTSLISLIIKGNWGLFGYGCGSSSGASRSILFAPGASILVYKSSRGIGCGNRGSSRGGNSIGISKIIGSRYLFFVRVIKPDRIGPLIRSDLAANISSFDYICYISSFIIVCRVFIIVLVLPFYYINTLPHQRVLYRHSISGSSNLLKSSQ